MRINIFKVALLLSLFYISCDDANELLNQHLKDGPIVYAGKIDQLDIRSGHYRIRVNLYPSEDVNRSHCILSWNVTNGIKDSVRVEYLEANYDQDLGCYYTLISLPSIEGNLLIEAQNMDMFGNRSLITSEGAFVYGSNYVSTLQNSLVSFTPAKDEITFANRVGAVGNLLSYEQNNGQFTEEIFVSEESHPLVDAKSGGIVRTRTQYLMADTDIDALMTAAYLETVIP